MRPIREISADEERFRLEPHDGFNMVRRDPVQPEPVGTIILMPMRVVGYDPDCDGSLLARLEHVSIGELDRPTDPEILAADRRDVQYYGVITNRGLYPSSGIVATADEIRALWPSPPGTEAR